MRIMPMNFSTLGVDAETKERSRDADKKQGRTLGLEFHGVDVFRSKF